MFEHNTFVFIFRSKPKTTLKTTLMALFLLTVSLINGLL